MPIWVHVLGLLIPSADGGELALKWREAAGRLKWKELESPYTRNTHTHRGPRSSLQAAADQHTAMANIAVQRIKREFKEVVKSEEVR